MPALQHLTDHGLAETMSRHTGKGAVEGPDGRARSTGDNNVFGWHALGLLAGFVALGWDIDKPS
jgi:hypothetical protein